MTIKEKLKDVSRAKKNKTDPIYVRVEEEMQKQLDAAQSKFGIEHQSALIRILLGEALEYLALEEQYSAQIDAIAKKTNLSKKEVINKVFADGLKANKS